MLRVVIFALLSGAVANQSLRSPAKPAVAPATNAPKASAEHATEHKKTVLVNGKKEKTEDAKVPEAKVEKKAEAKVEKKVEKKVEPKKVEAKKVETAVKTEVKVESKVAAAPVPKAATDAKADAKVASAEPKATEVKAKADEAKVEQPAILVKADKPPAEEPKAAPPLLTSSAADVYARVNFLLNRMDADQKKRNHVEEPAVEEEAAKIETPTKAEPAAKEEPIVRTEAPKAKVEAPKVEAKVEVKKAPKVEAKKVEAPKAKAAPMKAKPAPTAAPKEEDGILDSTVLAPKHSEDPAVKTAAKVANWVEAPKEAATEKVAKSSRALTVEEKREADFPRDWMKNDVKYNADHDKMADREQSIEDQVKAQREWNTKGEAWIQTKIFHLRGWGQMQA